MTETILTDADLERSYTRALGSYMLFGGEGPLQEAYELGRKGLTGRHGVLDMVALYHVALASVVREYSGCGLTADSIARAGEFFAESMSPFEMAHRAIDEANTALRKLNDTLEEEVRRIALALHDDSGQFMVIAQMKLDETLWELPAASQEKLREVKAVLDRVDDRIRHLSHELHPAMLDHLGLVPAIEFLASKVAERTTLCITVESSLKDRLPARLAITLYRIVQEALTNVRRHAHATAVRIRIRREGDRVSCVVADNGVGFDSDQLGRAGLVTLGLRGILERLNTLGGKLRIRSAAGRGTKLEVTVPLREEICANPGPACGRSLDGS